MIKEHNVESAQKTTKTIKLSWVAIIILGMLSAFGPVCTDIYLPAIPNITNQFAISASQVQLSLTTSFLGLALGQILIGPLSDAYGRKVPLLICLLVFVLSSIACAFADNIIELLIFRALQGLSGAGGVVIARTIACDLYSGPSLTEFMAILMAINSIAPIISPIIGSVIMNFFAWPALFIFLALWGTFLFISCAFKLQETLPKNKRHAHIIHVFKDLASQMVNLKFLAMCLVCAINFGAFIGYLSSSSFIFQNIYGFSTLEYALIFAINASAMALGAQIAGRLVRKYKEYLLLKIALFVHFMCGVGLIFIIGMEVKTYVYTTIAFCIFALSVSMAQTLGFSLVMGFRSGAAGAASGFFGVLNFLIGACLSPVVGLLGEYSMLPQALLMIICPSIASILFFIVRRMQIQSAS